MTDNDFNKIPLKISFATTVKDISQHIFQFNKIELDDSIFPKEMSNYFHNLSIEVNYENSSYWLLIKADFEKTIKKDSKKYIECLKYIPLNTDYNYAMFNGIIIKEWIMLYEKFIGNLMKYLKWRKGLIQASIHEEPYITKLSWQFDNINVNDRLDDKWTMTGVHITGSPINISSNDFVDYKASSGQLSGIPVHQELWFEVEKLIYSRYYRAAYITMYSALEIATKQLIAKLYPDTKWLIENMPSPDLMKIYSNFIHPNIGEIILADEMPKLKDINNARNIVAHQGQPIELTKIEGHKKYVELWLRRIDFRMGYSWSIA